MRVHKRCGDECNYQIQIQSQLKTFNCVRRKILNFSKQSLSPFEQLPKLK